MTYLSNSSALFKPELSSSSTGAVADGGWRRWWREQSLIDGTDWRTLLDAASAVLSRLRVVHGGIVLMSEWKKIAADAWDNPGWKQAAHEYHQARGGRVLIVEIPPENLARLRRLMSNDVLLDAAWAELNDPRNRPTPKATIEAVMHAVKKRGLTALKESAMKERLARCDAAARAEMNERMEKLGLES
jgi:hypothetical protein